MAMRFMTYVAGSRVHDEAIQQQTHLCHRNLWVTALPGNKEAVTPDTLIRWLLMEANLRKTSIVFTTLRST